MGMIQEQVDNLREFAGIYKSNTELSKIMYQAAEIIEDLFEGNGSDWIYCGDGNNMPEEHETSFAKHKGTDKWRDSMFERMSDDVNVTVEYENGKRETKTMHTIDGKWENVIRIVKFKVIAWRPLPLHYHD